MFIPFGAFIAGGIIQQYLNRSFAEGKELFDITPSSAQIKTILLIFILSFLASLLSPYFIKQYAIGSMALGSDWWRQEIMELQKPTWHNMKYPFIMAPIVILTFVLDFLFARQQKRGLAPLIHLILVLPFLYLSFTAMRFIFLFAIVSAPVVARNLSGILKNGRLEVLF